MIEHEYKQINTNVQTHEFKESIDERERGKFYAWRICSNKRILRAEGIQSKEVPIFQDLVSSVITVKIVES